MRPSIRESRSLTVRFGHTTRKASEKRASCRLAALLSPDQVMIIAITSVLPLPVAIFTAHRSYASYFGMVMPTRRSGVASVRNARGLDCFLLTEEGAVERVFPLGVEPAVEQLPSHRRRSRVAFFTPAS